VSTSQLLRDLVGINTLSISSTTNDKIMNLRGGQWIDNVVPTPRGLTLNDKFVAHTSRGKIIINDKVSNKNVISYQINNDSIHQIRFDQESNIIACDTKNSKLIKCNALGFNDYWVYPGSENNQVGTYAILNGICKYNDVVKYATVLGVSSNINIGDWKNSAQNKQGILIDVETNEIILNSLFMPHSPIVINDYIYVLNSGSGELIRIQIGRVGSYEIVGSYNKWLRGICQLNDQYLAIGVSQGRETAFDNLEIDMFAQPGIMVVDINTGEMIEFEALDVREIFDVLVTPFGVISE
jgi:hypothetical protein